MFRAGDARHRIRIEVRSSSQDTAGEPYENWQTFATVRAAMQRTTGQELFEASQRNARVATTFRIRYLAGVTPAMRLVNLANNAVYDIVSVIDQGGRGEELVIQATEQVGVTAGPDGGPYVPPITTVDAGNVTVTPAGNLSSTDAQSALVELQGDVDGLGAADTTEAAARAAADTAEASARASADTTLQSNIDAEATARASAITAEATARANADTTLQANIDAEATARANADSAINAQLIAADGTHTGFVTTLAQSFAGLKTFIAGIALQAKLSITGVASGAAAVELPDGSTIVSADAASAGNTASLSLKKPVAGGAAVEIDGGGVTNALSLLIKNAGNGTGGLKILHATSLGGQLYFGLFSGPQNHIYSENRGLTLRVNGAAYDTSPQAFLLMSGGWASKTTLTVQGSSGQSGDLQQWNVNGGSALSKVNKDGQLEVTTAGGYFAIAKSPNGTRYGISVANDGTLVTTAL